MNHKKTIIACGLAIVCLITVSGCTQEKTETPPSDSVAVTEISDQSKLLNLYDDKQGGFVVSIIDGWEVSDTNNGAYLTLTPTAENPVKNACIVITFQTDYTLDNTYEMFLNTMNIKDILKYTYNGTKYDTMQYYYEVPVEEDIGGMPTMVEVPKLSLVGDSNSNEKLSPKTKFYHYGGSEPNRNFMIGYISDEGSEAYAESVVREMIPNTKENRVQDLNRNNTEATDYTRQTLSTNQHTLDLLIPSSWEKVQLNNNGILYRSSAQKGSSFEDCYMLVLSERNNANNADILNYLEKNKFKIANATMRVPTSADIINLDSKITFDAINNDSVLGLDAITTNFGLTVGRGGTEMEIEEIPDKTEQATAYSFVQNDNNYLFVFGRMNVDTDAYKTNVNSLSKKILNSIVFE